MGKLIYLTLSIWFQSPTGEYGYTVSSREVSSEECDYLANRLNNLFENVSTPYLRVECLTIIVEDPDLDDVRCVPGEEE